ncbi:FAD-dependent oxidoreductase [Rheinheimera sp.]|uniref:flavin monoamine oxidase family protein n=1 Tax=Rheinheimera sp. TaxID=1869214 RepID=UPI002734F242|nr:FAD-dependent oxidoreductase [Rheinheimera sp.]MDP2715655.1 FAD-dependent oxidoreductase [Rheinheimera sp.]
MSNYLKTPITRRQCLNLLAKAGGSSAVLHAAGLFGLTATPAAASPVSLKPLMGKKRTVLILGAGISGLTAAYELERAGYSCRIIEASHRIGGRVMTLRHGDFIDELGAPQICPFDDAPNLYFNAGAARIPAHHSGILHYCRLLGVELQLFCNHNKNCYTQDDAIFGGKPLRIREYEADVRGFIGELLAKSAGADAKAELPFNAEDLEKLVSFAKAYGDLTDDLRYRGSERAGYASGGITAPGVLKTPRPLADLLRSDFAAGAMHFAEIADQAPALMTPTGGMDSIVRAFLRQLTSDIQLNCQVSNIQLLPQGVAVTYLQQGERYTEQADYCLNCIPAQLVSGIESNLPANYLAIMRQLGRGKLTKIGLQAKQRFWEQEDIYSGISWTNQDITQIWYPQHDAFKAKGILLGAYSWVPEISDRFAAMTHPQRLATAIAQGTKVHTDYAQHIESGVSVCWQRMNHMLGCGAVWSEALHKTGFALLQAPAGNHYLIGDQLSMHPGWQEGAVRSAWHALADIERREATRSKKYSTGVMA